MRIVLVGYMASGKSTVGKRLAEAFNLNFLDLDEAIENEVGIGIPELFEQKGEVFFRKKEAKVLHKILGENAYVLSTGGGTPCYGENMKNMLVKSDATFYLKLSLPGLLERIRMEKANRPVVSGISDTDLDEFVGKHLFERSFFYNKAEKTIACDGKTVETIVEEIRSYLDQPK